MMSNQLATTTNKELAPLVQGVDIPLRTDLVVPYITIQQATSDLVKERKAQMGDIVRSTTGEKIADPDTGFDVILLHNPKADWVIEQKQGERFKYKKSIERTADNEMLPWTFWGDEDGNEVAEKTKGATAWRRVKRLTVFALLPGDIAAEAAEMAKADAGELPDPSKALTPVVLSFRSTSYETGKNLCTFFSQALAVRANIWKYKVHLSAKLEKRDNDSWYVWQAQTVGAKAVEKANLPRVEEWVRAIGLTSLIIHEEGETEAVATERTVVETKDVC